MEIQPYVISRSNFDVQIINVFLTVNILNRNINIIYNTKAYYLKISNFKFLSQKK